MSAQRLGVVAILILFHSLLGQADPVPAIDQIVYGDLYTAYDTYSNAKRVDLGIGFATVFSVPQYNLTGMALEADYWTSETISLGGRFTFLWPTLTAQQQVLKEIANWDAIQLVSPEPRASVSLRAGYAPLHGLVNLFGKQVVTYDLSFGAGLSVTRMDPGGWSPGGLLFLEQKILLSQHLGLTMGYMQTWERLAAIAPYIPEAGLFSRGQFELGVYARF